MGKREEANMKIEDFHAGTTKQQYQYKIFSPASINKEWVWEAAKINTLLEQATRALGELNAFSLIVPDVDMFIKMHIVKEANISSRIEGTKTNIDEAVMNQEQIIPEKRDDWQEVQNYVAAMNYAIEKLKQLPLSCRLIKETHGILLQGVRGSYKTPGEFRRSQNWIGGSSLQDATFIPPHHHEIPELMTDLENFWHNENIDVPHLVRIAISHYQFETIHPFLDGNGRIGRLLITIYLVSHGILAKPSLYLSDYFEKHKGIYYDALMMARESHHLVHWIKFFLVAVVETAQKGKQTFQNILHLRSEFENKILTLGKRTKNAHTLLTFLYGKPVVTVSDIATYLQVTHQTANHLIKDFEKLYILKETTGYQRNRLFIFDKYLKLFID
jgi:Fic family protein